MSANPQGKGLVPVVEDWREAQPAVVSARTPREVLRDYLVTSLVVAAEIRFKPRPGIHYFLYLIQSNWTLSLLSPEDWHGHPPGPCLGRCVMQPDMTWQLTPRADINRQDELVKALSAFREGFADWLNQDGTLEDHLPFYVRELPYYRRLLAAGMSNSLQSSLAKSGLDARSSRDWLAGQELPALLS
ncbi:hypothetical protein A3709_08880 [Halioglobus sp. HI00S01]|uniref:DUF2452 domain-containing protein n=1 Tax=Halioglobus sp. HI00S01 TaxID=1822214 RepID=UPI0007C2296B|nr:DUF2452 domain-containing protein [Halioglobus sp. HI00S01]KZX55094.1 hypothetical protein A3709_08880 [Halioglobus sp. HI00S01]